MMKAPVADWTVTVPVASGIVVGRWWPWICR